MLRSKAFVKVTKKGSLVNVVREHYLRDDITCGMQNCTICSPVPEDSTTRGTLSSSLPNSNALFPFSHYIIPDTNIFLHQMDILQHVHFSNVIVLQTVLDEVKHQNLAIYERLRTMTNQIERNFYVFSNEHHRQTYIEKEKGESPNDRNDRAIRTAVQWYSGHLNALASSLEGIPKVVFISDDLENRNKTLQLGCLFAHMAKDLLCLVKEYIQNVDEFPELLDMLNLNEDENFRVSQLDKREANYDQYFPAAQLHEGIRKGIYYSGTMCINPYNMNEGSVICGVQGKTETITVTNRKDLNRAIHGDVVVMDMLPKDKWVLRAGDSLVIDEDDDTAKKSVVSVVDNVGEQAKMTGRVIGIIKRSGKQYVGSIHVDTGTGPSSAFVLFTPLDRKVPKIRVRTRNAHHLAGQRIVVTLDGWPVDSQRPLGHFVRTLGSSGDKNTETEALLLEHDIPVGEFSKAILQCLPSPQWSADAAMDPAREDFRSLPTVCSIDPPGCTDIDDALHVILLPNGHYQVGVHIADVSYFVSLSTPLDVEASLRGTTVYLVDRRIDMLPSLLGTNLCSLRSNEDRFAFSVIWEMTDQAEMVSVRFTKSVIRSKASLTYEEAQVRLDDQSMNDPVSQSIRRLNGLAKKLRARRMAAGALTLASPEVRFALENDSQDPVDVEMKALKETNALVEEFMLLANTSVARKIHETYPELSLLRRHPSPPEANFDMLTQAAALKGFSLHVSSSKALADSLDMAVLSTEPYFNNLLRIMTTRCMMQAVYFCSGSLPEKDYWHYGLASPIYTHFTSPIRRYADLMVHRLLAATINSKDTPSWNSITRSAMEELCDNLNYRHRMAQMASRASVELYTYLFFKGKAVEEEAFVIRVLKNALVVLIPKYGIEGLIRIEPVDENIVFDAMKCAFVDVSDGLVLVSIFDKLKVRLTIADEALGTFSISRQKLNVTWLDAPSLLAENKKVKRKLARG